MAKWQYSKGMHEVGANVWAYLQPDGSNADLIVNADQTPLLDTLFDLKLTTQMLDAMRRPVPSAAHISTHAKGDQCHGNELVAGAEIIGSDAAWHELEELPRGDALRRVREHGDAVRTTVAVRADVEDALQAQDRPLSWRRAPG